MVMANVFFNTPEYLAFNRDDNGFVTDLYNTFFSRLPDAGGLSYWLGQLAAGMPRNNVMSSFLFSPEFTTTMNAAFPGQTARAETYLVLNLYGGLFRRLAETGRLHLLDRAVPDRAVQCQSGNRSAGYDRQCEQPVRGQCRVRGAGDQQQPVRGGPVLRAVAARCRSGRI